MNPFMIDGAAYADALFDEAYGEDYGGCVSGYNPWDDSEQRTRLINEWKSGLTLEDRRKYAHRMSFKEHAKTLLNELNDHNALCRFNDYYGVIIKDKIRLESISYDIFSDTFESFDSLSKTCDPNTNEFYLYISSMNEYVRYDRWEKFGDNSMIMCSNVNLGEILIFRNEGDAKTYLKVQALNNML